MLDVEINSVQVNKQINAWLQRVLAKLNNHLGLSLHATASIDFNSYLISLLQRKRAKVSHTERGSSGVALHHESLAAEALLAWRVRHMYPDRAPTADAEVYKI